MSQLLYTSLRAGDLIQPRIVSTLDLLAIIGDLFSRKFETISQMADACITDLLVWDFEQDNSIEYVRKLISEVSKRPSGPYQVFVLVGIDMMTDQASNALLKTFEDISPYSLFLMTCKNPHSLLPTIQSRIVISSYDQIGGSADEEVASEVRSFLTGSPLPLLARILGTKIEGSQCLEILQYLQLAIKDGTISHSADIQAISRAVYSINTSNVTAKYQLDTLLFQLLAGKN